MTKLLYLIKKRENIGLENLKDPKALLNIQIIWRMCKKY